jgi:molecular chaperone DnaK
MVHRAGQVVTVTPRAAGILIEDSFDPTGRRSFVEHLIAANTPLPVELTETQFDTIVQHQQSVRIQVYEQAGPVPSTEIDHDRRVLDGELARPWSLCGGRRRRNRGRTADEARRPDQGTRIMT